MSNAFPGLQWGNFSTGGAQQAYHQQPPQRPAVVAQQVQVPEVDFADGLNNPIELALHPNVDLIGLEAAGPFLEPGGAANFRTVITRTDRPGWQQEIAGQATMNPDGSGSQTRCQMGPAGQPVMQLFEQAQTNMLSGTTIQGQVVPGRQQGANEQLQVTPGMDGSLRVQGHVDGWQIFEQSQQGRDPQGGWGTVTTHSGNIAGTQFQRILRPQQDGSKAITGQIGNLPETGRVVTDQMGQTYISRDIGPYHLEQQIWIVAGQGQGMGMGQGFF